MIKAIKKLLKGAINNKPEIYKDRDGCLVFINKQTGKAIKMGHGEFLYSDKQDDNGYYVFD